MSCHRMKHRRLIVAVVGGHSCTKEVEEIFEKLGEKSAKVGAIVVSGGLSGVMESVSKGAKSAGGVTVGILPSQDKSAANVHTDIPIPTGLGFARNALVAGCADMVIALPGEYGTLSEIAFARNSSAGIPGFKAGEECGAASGGNTMAPPSPKRGRSPGDSTMKKPVISIGSWDIPGVVQVQTAQEAIQKVKQIIAGADQRSAVPRRRSEKDVLK